MNKKISTIIAAILAVVLGVYFAVSSFGFIENDYGADQIAALSELGIIPNKSADANVTRGEAFAAVSIIASIEGGVETLGYDAEVFDSDGNITLYEMVVMALRACGYTVGQSDYAYDMAEEAKLYKVCADDALIIDIPYAAYAEILWNMLSFRATPTSASFAEQLIEADCISQNNYDNAAEIVSDYVFGQPHSYSTGAVTVSEEETETSEPEETTATPVETTSKPADTTTKPAVTTAKPVDTTRPIQTEDNSGYSPPFRP